MNKRQELPKASGAVTSIVAMTTASQEYSFAIPQNTQHFTIKLRNSGTPWKVAIGETASLTATQSIQLQGGQSYGDSGLNVKAGQSLYFQAATPSQVAEIVHWK